MNIYEQMECDLFHNSLIDQKDAVKQATEQSSEANELVSNFYSIINDGDNLEYENTSGVKSKIPRYTGKKYQSEAYKTWNDFYYPDDASKAIKSYINGTLSCFCDDEYEKHGMMTIFYNYRSDGFEQLPLKI